MAARTVAGKAARVGQACPSVLQSRGHRGAFGADQKYSAGTALSSNHRHCEERKRRSNPACFPHDGLLRRYAPRNDERKSVRRHDRALDLAKTDAKTVALAPTAHHERIAV